MQTQTVFHAILDSSHFNIFILQHDFIQTRGDLHWWLLNAFRFEFMSLLHQFSCVSPHSLVVKTLMEEGLGVLGWVQKPE